MIDLLVLLPFLLIGGWLAWLSRDVPKPPTVYLRGTPNGPVSTDIEVKCKNYPDWS